jgi:hypothetical protein
MSENNKALQKTNGSISLYDAKSEGFVRILNQNPNPKEIQTNKAANGSQYLPISHIEMQLDELFQGLWQTRGFSFHVVANEIVGSIELGLFHPVLQQWIWRTGAAATMIQQKKGADITDINAKHKNTLVKDFPHLKAECLKNAAKSLGRIFGRDLNRAIDDTYLPGSTQEIMAEAQESKAFKEIAEEKDIKRLSYLFNIYSSIPGVPQAITKRRKELQQNAGS